MRYMTPKLKAMLHGGDYNPDQWLNHTEILQQDIALMKEANCNAMSIGIFAWATLEPEEGKYRFDWLDSIIDNMYKNGIYTVLATPSGARPAWMAQKYPEILRVNSDGKRIPFTGRHNHCYSSPIYREKVAAMNGALAERYSHHPGVVLWHISNEYNGACHCELCTEGFRNWLKKKYGTLENLNEQWWSTFWSHNITDWSQIHSPLDGDDHSVHGLTLDWNRYTTDMTVDFMKHEIAPLKAANPELPVTANLMGFYDGLNYFKFKDVCDVISWDNYPTWHSQDDTLLATDVAMAHDLMRSIKPGNPFLLMESVPSATNWQPVSKLKRPGMNMLSSIQAVAHGSDSVQYFQWRKSRGSAEKFHGAVVDHYGKSDNRVFQDVAALGHRLEGLDDIVGTTYNAKAAIIWDTENRWAIDAMQGLRRRDRGYLTQAADIYRVFAEKGVNVDLIDMEGDFSGYKLVVAPMLYMLRAGITEKLKAFVSGGGTLVVTYWSGIVNENDLCYLGGFPGDGFGELVGLRSEEIDALYPNDRNTLKVCAERAPSGLKNEYVISEYCDLVHLTTAQSLAEYGEDFYAGRPALTVNEYGQGKAYYVAAKLDMEFNRDFYGALIDEKKLVPLGVTLPRGVYLTTRTDEDSGVNYYFLQNYNTYEVGVDLPEDMSDVETGKKLCGRAVLEPYGTMICAKRL